MKISYKHLVKHIFSKPSKEEISDKLFQLGHEHEIENQIYDIEITPNRGDCLSLNGVLRDLSVFYDIDLNKDKYDGDIKDLTINFENNAKNDCPFISFLKVDIDSKILPYSGDLDNYFKDLKINKNNLFTDISNYISYETGQPTHCYDAQKIGNSFTLEYIDGEEKFETLMDKNIQLSGKNLVFKKNGEIINLAGIMGGKSTACSEKTRSVIVECAYFNPESIIGKSVKYDLNSDAAYKFERGVDPLGHELALRRFIQILSEHSNIINIEWDIQDIQTYKSIKIEFNKEIINKIIGQDISKNDCINYLIKLGFKIDDDFITAPSHRNDISSINDIAEEIARVIGYDNINRKKIKIKKKKFNNINHESKIRSFLVEEGFFEVINNPFVSDKSSESIILDNPLDTNKKYLRTNLKKSLINNLLYNERRQNESIKLFEFSEVYSQNEHNIDSKKMLGVIGSGRVGKNYIDFSKKIDTTYFKTLFSKLFSLDEIEIEQISRQNLDTKIKNQIVYFEINLNELITDLNMNNDLSIEDKVFVKYSPISEFPKIVRDLSFSLDKYKNVEDLQNLFLKFSDKNLKDIFIFDFFDNPSNGDIKIGFRFTFQSTEKTLTEIDVNIIMDKIINQSISISGVNIPGLKQ
tara:strand:- start:4481 stop:6391 length:1911 start_codon:yes stop_codon:yes gene_type:complete